MRELSQWEIQAVAGGGNSNYRTTGGALTDAIAGASARTAIGTAPVGTVNGSALGLGIGPFGGMPGEHKVVR